MLGLRLSAVETRKPHHIPLIEVRPDKEVSPVSVIDAGAFMAGNTFAERFRLVSVSSSGVISGTQKSPDLLMSREASEWGVMAGTPLPYYHLPKVFGEVSVKSFSPRLETSSGVSREAALFVKSVGPTGDKRVVVYHEATEDDLYLVYETRENGDLVRRREPLERREASFPDESLVSDYGVPLRYQISETSGGWSAAVANPFGGTAALSIVSTLGQQTRIRVSADRIDFGFTSVSHEGRSVASVVSSINQIPGLEAVALTPGNTILHLIEQNTLIDSLEEGSTPSEKDGNLSLLRSRHIWLRERGNRPLEVLSVSQESGIGTWNGRLRQGIVQQPHVITASEQAKLLSDYGWAVSTEATLEYRVSYEHRNDTLRRSVTWESARVAGIHRVQSLSGRLLERPRVRVRGEEIPASLFEWDDTGVTLRLLLEPNDRVEMRGLFYDPAYQYRGFFFPEQGTFQEADLNPHGSVKRTFSGEERKAEDLLIVFLYPDLILRLTTGATIRVSTQSPVRHAWVRGNEIASTLRQIRKGSSRTGYLRHDQETDFIALPCQPLGLFRYRKRTKLTGLSVTNREREGGGFRRDTEELGWKADHVYDLIPPQGLPLSRSHTLYVELLEKDWPVSPEDLERAMSDSAVPGSYIHVSASEES